MNELLITDLEIVEVLRKVYSGFRVQYPDLTEWFKYGRVLTPLERAVIKVTSGSKEEA